MDAKVARSPDACQSPEERASRMCRSGTRSTSG
jgi:hypothetical protein